jgi:hypothetical protein
VVAEVVREIEFKVGGAFVENVRVEGWDAGHIGIRRLVGECKQVRGRVKSFARENTLPAYVLVSYRWFSEHRMLFCYLTRRSLWLTTSSDMLRA